MAKNENIMSVIRISDDIAKINPGKMLDNYNAPEIVNILDSERTQGIKNVIIDMAELEFLSSAGVGALLGNVESFRAIGGDIILCNLSSTIYHILQLLDVADYLTIRHSETEAMTLSKSKG